MIFWDFAFVCVLFFFDVLRHYNTLPLSYIFTLDIKKKVTAVEKLYSQRNNPILKMLKKK